jgi:hypothetical protein
MRTFLIGSAFLCGLATLQTASAQEKRAKWEYAELVYRTVPARPAGKDKDGNEVPAVPAGVSIRWTTGAGEVNVKGWDELAEKLKTTLKKEDSISLQKIQTLNLLGGDGWELVEQQGGSTTTPVSVAPPGFGAAGGPQGPRGGGGPPPTITMLFKRRVP